MAHTPGTQYSRPTRPSRAVAVGCLVLGGLLLLPLAIAVWSGAEESDAMAAFMIASFLTAIALLTAGFFLTQRRALVADWRTRQRSARARTAREGRPEPYLRPPTVAGQIFMPLGYALMAILLALVVTAGSMAAEIVVGAILMIVGRESLAAMEIVAAIGLLGAPQLLVLLIWLPLRNRSPEWRLLRLRASLWRGLILVCYAGGALLTALFPLLP